jgi:hypothetical protein
MTKIILYKNEEGAAMMVAPEFLGGLKNSTLDIVKRSKEKRSPSYRADIVRITFWQAVCPCEMS